MIDLFSISLLKWTLQNVCLELILYKNYENFHNTLKNEVVFLYFEIIIGFYSINFCSQLKMFTFIWDSNILLIKIIKFKLIVYIFLNI